MVQWQVQPEQVPEEVCPDSDEVGDGYELEVLMVEIVEEVVGVLELEWAGEDGPEQLKRRHSSGIGTHLSGLRLFYERNIWSIWCLIIHGYKIPETRSQNLFSSTYSAQVFATLSKNVLGSAFVSVTETPVRGDGF